MPKGTEKQHSENSKRVPVLTMAQRASATNDQEVAVVAPLLISAVFDLPVLLAVQITATDQGDDVATKVTAGSMLVHARLVRGEIAVHRERDRERKRHKQAR